jgi:hypothetical protein
MDYAFAAARVSLHTFGLAFDVPPFAFLSLLFGLNLFPFLINGRPMVSLRQCQMQWKQQEQPCQCDDKYSHFTDFLFETVLVVSPAAMSRDISACREMASHNSP